MNQIPCEVYSRIVGYLRPIRGWNVAKRQEFKERKLYDLDKVLPPAKGTLRSVGQTVGGDRAGMMVGSMAQNAADGRAD